MFSREPGLLSNLPIFVIWPWNTILYNNDNINSECVTQSIVLTGPKHAAISINKINFKIIYTYIIIIIYFSRNFTTENLRFLNVDQALADLAYFIQAMKQQPRFVDSPVILYGGSYAANMVLWFKQRYPHLVLGTVASSGPIKGQVDFTGWYKKVIGNQRVMVFLDIAFETSYDGTI